MKKAIVIVLYGVLKLDVFFDHENEILFFYCEYPLARARVSICYDLLAIADDTVNMLNNVERLYEL